MANSRVMNLASEADNILNTSSVCINRLSVSVLLYAAKKDAITQITYWPSSSKTAVTNPTAQQDESIFSANKVKY